MDGSSPAYSSKAPVQPFVQDNHADEMSNSTKGSGDTSIPSDTLVGRKAHNNDRVGVQEEER